MLAFVWSYLDFNNRKTLWKVGTLFQKQENCIKSTKNIKIGLLMELLIIPVQYSIIFASQGWWVVCTKITGSQRRSNSIVDKKNDKKKNSFHSFLYDPYINLTL